MKTWKMRHHLWKGGGFEDHVKATARTYVITVGQVPRSDWKREHFFVQIVQEPLHGTDELGQVLRLERLFLTGTAAIRFYKYARKQPEAILLAEQL